MNTKMSFRAALAAERESLLQEIREEAAQRAAAVPEAARVWLALAPAWTLELARAAGLPTEGDMRDLLRQALAADLCESGTNAPAFDDDDEAGDSSPNFWMTDTVRRETIQRVIGDVQRGRSYLQQMLKVIGEGILAASRSQVKVAAAILRWAELAAAALRPYQLRDLFDRRVNEAFERNDPGVALRWIEAARPIEELLKGELSTAVARAVRQLELHHRYADDERRLANFLERPEQLAAFDRLIAGKGGAWALHYVGPAGMGKTMLIRHLTARVIPKQLEGSTARIDFDYLNPNYPVRAPGLLLSQLIEELRRHDRTGEATRQFISVAEKIDRTHETLSDVTSLSSPQTAFGEVLGLLPLLVEPLRKLPQPIVIVLDTCEELAKIRPDSAERSAGNDILPPSVKATFDLFERLHELYPAMRVIFSGRRPLASAGAGWSYPSSPLSPRPYLLAHAVRGFLDEDADRYLRDKRATQADFIAPIKAHCLTDGTTRGFEWEDPAQRDNASRRYHPFDLSLYASWVLEDRTLTPAALKGASTDRYIELRIVGRINDSAVRALLPYAALMGRFDTEILRMACSLDEPAFDLAFKELANQEWVNRQSAETLEVEPPLQKRLLNYYSQAAPLELEAARRSLSAQMEKLTLEEPLAKLDAVHFRTTLRLLEPEPQRAATWWARVEARFAAEQAYDWARRVCELLLGDEEEEAAETTVVVKSTTTTQEAAAQPDPRLRAAVRATYAAAQLREGAFDKLMEIWPAVENYAVFHPLPAEIPALRLRAVAGFFAAALRVSVHPTAAGVQKLCQALNQCDYTELDDQLAASLVAALELLFDAAEDEQQFLQYLRDETVIHLAKTRRDAGLCACAHVLAGRLLALRHQQPKEIARWFRQALDLIKDFATSQQTPQVWLDWLAPVEIPARVRLESIRHLYPAIYDSAETLRVAINFDPQSKVDLDKRAWLRIISIESDRLNAAVLRLREELNLRLPEEIGELLEQSRWQVNHQPLCNAHTEFPPFFAAAAEVWATTGRIDDALELLQAQSGASEATAIDFHTVREADRALLRVVRRLRLRDEGYGGDTSLDQSTLISDRELIWAVDEFACPKEPADYTMPPPDLLQPARYEWNHARFRTFCTRPKARAKVLIELVGGAMPAQSPLPEKATFAELACFWDAIEANIISHGARLSSPFPQLQRHELRRELLNTIKAWHRYWNRPAEALTLLLRAQALTAPRGQKDGWEDELAGRIGPRRAANIALDEGELLALRLPARATRLLDRSYVWFIACHDYHSAFIAKLCAALALARLGNAKALLHMLAEARSAYTISSLGLLMKWEDVEALADDASLDKRLDAMQVEIVRRWRPWVVRLLACLIWLKEHQRPPQQREGTRRLIEWLRTNYGTTVDDKKLLPTELEGWLKARPPQMSVPTKAPKIEVRLRHSQTAWRPLQSADPDAPPFHARVNISLQDGTTAFKQEIVPVSGLAPYREEARRLFDAAPKIPLWNLLGEFCARHTEIELQVDQYATWVSWEALIMAALRLWQPKVSAINFRRTITQAKARRVKRWDKEIGVLTRVNEPAFEDVARQGWGGLVGRAGFNYECLNSEAAHSVKRRLQVLHLIGTPIETSSGIRFDMAARRAHRELTIFSRGEVMRADQVTTQYPDLNLCLLQAPPEDNLYSRTRDDRERAAYLRLLAAELFKLGVPAVLTIPNLPSPVASKVLSQFCSELADVRDASRQGPDWLSAVRAAQAAVIELGRNSDDGFEASFDICFYSTRP